MKKVLSVVLALSIICFPLITTYASESKIDQYTEMYNAYSSNYDFIKSTFPEASINAKLSRSEFDEAVTSENHGNEDVAMIPVESYSITVNGSLHNLDVYENGEYASYGAKIIDLKSTTGTRATNTSGFSVSDGVYQIYFYGSYAYGLQQMTYFTTKTGSTGNYHFSTPYGLGVYLINTKEFYYPSSNILSITYRGNLQEMWVFGSETYYHEYMGVEVIASVNIATGTILVEHNYLPLIT